MLDFEFQLQHNYVLEMLHMPNLWRPQFMGTLSPYQGAPSKYFNSWQQIKEKKPEYEYNAMQLYFDI